MTRRNRLLPWLFVVAVAGCGQATDPAAQVAGNLQNGVNGIAGNIETASGADSVSCRSAGDGSYACRAFDPSTNTESTLNVPASAAVMTQPTSTVPLAGSCLQDLAYLANQTLGALLNGQIAGVSPSCVTFSTELLSLHYQPFLAKLYPGGGQAFLSAAQQECSSVVFGLGRVGRCLRRTFWRGLGASAAGSSTPSAAAE